MTKENNTYTCSMCGYIGEKRPEEEALAELKEEFGNVSISDCGVVCDDCWEKVRPKDYLSDNQHQEQHERQAVLAVPESKKEEAANFLKSRFSSVEKKRFKKMIKKGTDRWWYAEYHLQGGLVIRNLLRNYGFGEKELKIENLDYIYVQIIERAVMGKEIDWEEK